MQVNLKRLLAGKEVVAFADPDLNASFKSLSGSSTLLTEAVQKAENQSLVKEEAIIGERTEADSTLTYMIQLVRSCLQPI